MTTLADFYRLFPTHAAVAAPVRQAPPSPAAERRLDPSQGRPAPRYRERSIGTGYGRSSGYGKLGAYTTAPAALVRVC